MPTSEPVTSTLIVEITVKPGMVDTVIEMTEATIRQVMQEPHFVEIRMNRRDDNPNALVLIEKWTSKAHLLSDAHLGTPYLTAYFEAVEPMLAEPHRWFIVDEVKTFSR